MHKVILDLQIGPNIDDLFTLALALCSPEIKLVGISTVHDEDGSGLRQIERLVSVYGKNVPVLTGCTKPLSPSGTATSDATRYMVKQVSDQPGEITLITTGPLTNAAGAIRQSKTFEKNVKAIISVAGWTDQQLPEWNVQSDPEAMRTVLGSNAPLTLFGLDVTTACRLNEIYLWTLRQSPSPGTQLLLRYLESWEQQGIAPVTLHDPLTVASLLNPSLVTMDQRRVSLDDSDPILKIDPSGKLTTVCHHVDILAYFNEIVERLTYPESHASIPQPSWAALHHSPPPLLYYALRLDYPKNWHLEPQSRNEYQLLKLEQGDMEIKTQEATYRLEVGDTFFIPPNVSYGLETNGGMRLSLIYFQMHTGMNGAENAPPWFKHRLDKATPIPRKYNYQMAPLIEKALDAHVSQSIESALISKAVLYEILAILNTSVGTRREDEDKLTAQQEEYTEAARRFIENRAMQSFSLDELALEINVSKHHLSRLFQRQYGVSPGAYHRRLRMEKARSLVTSGHFTISEVANRLGYSSIHSFSKAFKQYWGLSPTEYAKSDTWW